MTSLVLAHADTVCNLYGTFRVDEVTVPIITADAARATTSATVDAMANTAVRPAMVSALLQHAEVRFDRDIRRAAGQGQNMFRGGVSDYDQSGQPMSSLMTEREAATIQLKGVLEAAGYTVEMRTEGPPARPTGYQLTVTW